jgi:TM2 domain-containing membrane protein YozV
MKRNTLLIFVLLLFLPGLGQNAWGQAEGTDFSASEAKTDMVLEKKSPMGALLRSVAFPGWGQFYNRKYMKGVVVLGAEATFITMAIVDWSRMKEHQRNFQNPDFPDRYWEFDQFRFYEDRRNMFLWITAGIVFISMFDAYVDAHLYNFKKEEVRDLSISIQSGTDGTDQMKIVLSLTF